MAGTSTLENPQGGPSAFLVGRSLLEIAWSRKTYLALGVVVGLVLGLLFYVQATPIYQSKAQMLVVKKRPDNVTGIDTRNLAIEDYVATHKALIESPVIIERAIQKRGLANLESLRDKEELTEFVKKNLTVARNRGAGATTSNILDLAFRGTNAEETPIILNAVMDSYKEYLDVTYRNISEDTLKLVVKAQKVLEVDLRKQEEAYRAFRKDAPILIVRSKDGATLTQDRLSTIEKKRTALVVRKAELQGFLQAMDANLKQPDGGQEALLAMVAEWTARSDGDKYPERLTLHNQLFPLLLEEQKLLQTRGENHPEVQFMRKRIEVARVYLASPTGPWRKVMEKPGDQDAAVNPIAMFRDYFTQQLNHLEVSEKLLTELYKEEFDAARTLTSYELKDEQFRLDIERTQKLYDSIIKRLQEVDFIKDVGGYDANVIAAPALGKKVHPSGLVVMAVALLLGGLGGFGLAYLAEIMDKSFRSVDEVRLRLGLPVAGQIPFLERGEKAAPPAEVNGQVLDPILYVHHHPKSVEAESYRGVRTALYFNVHGKAHKIIQITSPASGDGKSTMAANLAISIAQSKKKVLLIDADMRKPTIHKLFGISHELGLSSVIVEEVEPKDAIQATAIPGLSILPCGPIPPNPAELLTSLRFEEFLNLLREQYDFVIVDTPPLLAVTDPSVVAHKVDGVFLNIRFTKNGRPDAERAKEMLVNLKANVIGVVINDAEQLLNTAGYGYGYGYGYGNSYLDPAPVEQVNTDQVRAEQ